MLLYYYMNQTPDSGTPRREPTRDEIISRSPFLRAFLFSDHPLQTEEDLKAWEEELTKLSNPLEAQLENKFGTPHWGTLAVGGLARAATNLGIFKDSVSSREIYQITEWVLYAGFELGDYKWARNFLDDTVILLDRLSLLHERTHIIPGVRHDPPGNIMMNSFIHSVMEAGAFYKIVSPEPLEPIPSTN